MIRTNIYIEMHFPLQFLILISLLLSIICSTNGQGWDYHALGPDVWGDRYPTCAGHQQSPINIRTACTTYRTFTPFQFSSAYNLKHNFTLTNNGHTIEGTYNGSNPTPLTLTGGGLDGTFEFDNFHLHWGKNYKSGSEHQINGVKYAGEIHFVHTNPKTNESAVLSFLMQSNQNTNASVLTRVRKRSDDINNTSNSTANEWKRYFDISNDLRNRSDSTILKLNLTSLMGDNLNDFWRYEGSLTTPPCTEGIIWTIFKTPIVFNDSDIDTFRKNILFEGYREPQPLYDRLVYQNFPNKTLSSIPDYNYCSKNSNNSSNKLFLSIIDIIFLCFLVLEINNQALY